MLHILDEPTIGLHPADVQRVLPAFRRLAGPALYVEHNRLAARFADRAVDLGPAAGPGGGRILYDGPPAGLLEADTPTGRAFRAGKARPRARAALPPPERFLRIRGAALHNLRHIDVEIPLSRLTAVTGVSGSGKSTLVQDVLVASLHSHRPVGCLSVDPPLGAPRALVVDQSPIGINPRSTPATYTGLSDHLRDIFAHLTGLDPSRFSFNRSEGACPECHGLGAVEVKLRLLPSTWIVCESCEGDRYSDEVLSARAALGGKELSIADLYRLPLSEIRDLLAAEHPAAAPDSSIASALRILDALCDTGLGYLSLGRSSPTLSGGEAQRIKLASRLGLSSLAGNLLVLDEPSTGLDPADLDGLLRVLDRLGRRGPPSSWWSTTPT